MFPMYFTSIQTIVETTEAEGRFNAKAKNLRSVGRGSGKAGPESLLNEVFVHSEGEVEGLIELVDPSEVILLQVFSKSLGRHGQVVVRDLREEEMVNHVTVGDVVMQRVNAKTEFSINSLKRSIHVLPVLVGVSDAVRAVMLQVGNGYEPPSEHDVRGPIKEGVVEEVPA